MKHFYGLFKKQSGLLAVTSMVAHQLPNAETYTFPVRVVFAFLEPIAKLVESRKDISEDPDLAPLRTAVGGRFSKGIESDVTEIDAISSFRFLSAVEALMGKDRNTFLAIKRSIDSLAFKVAMASSQLYSQINALTSLKESLGIPELAISCAFEVKREKKEKLDSAIKEVKRLNLLELVVKEKRQAELLLEIGDIIRLLAVSKSLDDRELQVLWDAFRHVEPKDESLSHAAEKLLVDLAEYSPYSVPFSCTPR